MLRIERVSVVLDQRPIVDGVDLEIAEGETLAVLGPSGSGKTTLLRTIAGLQRPLAGSIVFEGDRLDSLPPHAIVERGIVLVPEGRRLFGGMSVIENLELGAFTPRARKERERTLKRIFEIFPLLAERRHQYAQTMSGGQQQMLAIGRAIMGLPRLLMLDEPSLGLAPLLVEHIFDVVRAINAEGVTVLLVEQNARAALELASRAYIVEQGRIVGSGTGAALLHDPVVQQAYLGFAPAPV